MPFDSPRRREDSDISRLLLSAGVSRSPWRYRLRVFVAAALTLFLVAGQGTGQGAAQTTPDQAPQSQSAPSSGILSLLPPDATTAHVLERGEEDLAYTATAGTFHLRDRTGERAAAIFYTAYTLDGATARTRPVTFVFNGGPGASSAYLHLGLVGPRIVNFGPRPSAAAAQMESNPDTWLAFTDLVMLDPVGTGWSRAADPEDAEDFWGVDQDARSLAKAIALYLAKTGRLAAPKYLLGESYGGYRAVEVAEALQREQGTVVTGIVMVSPFLEGALHFGASRSALSAALLLPSIAATELDREGRFTPEALAAAERFAMTDYLVTLAKRPPEAEAGQDFYTRLAELSGLPVDVVARARGFIKRAYLRRTGVAASERISPYDATFAVPDPFPGRGRGHDRDPILDGYLQSLGGFFVSYARDRLAFETEMTYELLNRRVSREWDWNGGGGRRDASVTSDLGELLALHPDLQVLIAHGRSDLVTPYGVSRYVLDHLPEGDISQRTRLAIYKGGHMFYFDPASRAAFAADAATLYGRSAP